MRLRSGFLSPQHLVEQVIDAKANALGLATIGTAGQLLASNGTSLNWVNPSAGTGSVTSVSLAVAPSLSGLFTNTGSSTITTSGVFTLSQAASPSIALTTANFMTISNSATIDQTPLRILMPSMDVNTSNTINLGKVSDATGGTGKNKS